MATAMCLSFDALLSMAVKTVEADVSGCDGQDFTTTGDGLRDCREVAGQKMKGNNK